MMHFLCTLFLLFFLYLPAPLAAATPALFGTKETPPSGNLTPFPKWTGALDRYFEEKPLISTPCTPDFFNRCHLQEWNNYLATLKGKELKTQLSEINRFINNSAYILDPINWGVPDYWASPQQFFIKDGDCEDYAIAKFMSLRALGVPNEHLRIIVLEDKNLGIIHSVLAVYHGDNIFILDNQTPHVIEDKKIHHYTPVYSINETHWWKHY